MREKPQLVPEVTLDGETYNRQLMPEPFIVDGIVYTPSDADTFIRDASMVELKCACHHSTCGCDIPYGEDWIIEYNNNAQPMLGPPLWVQQEQGPYLDEGGDQ